MTTHDRDKIIVAAKEAGFIYYGEFPQDYKCKIEALYAIAHEDGRQAEREECAKTCMHQCSVMEEPHEFERCADAIRARGDTK